jgi:DNA repair protein RecO (recombination protein O)
VLRHRRLGDADRIVTLLTPGRGKVDAVAKGALRPRSKLAGHLEPGMLVDVLLAQGRTLDVVTQAQAISTYASTRGDLDRLGTALYLVEVTDRLTVDHTEPAAFDLLRVALERLDRGDGTHLLTRTFELELLSEAGFRPQWDSCIACSRPVEGDTVAWTPLGGGVVCGECRGRYPEAEPLAGTTLKVLRAIQRGPYEQAARIRLNPTLAAALERVLHDLVRSVAERDLASQRFIEAVRRTAEPVVLGEPEAG